jgi:hypothetical protein
MVKTWLKRQILAGGGGQALPVPIGLAPGQKLSS